MSKILFNTLVDLASAATPSNGFLIAYDIDGVLKQKDQYGVITAFGATGISASIPSLSQVLAVNNSTANYDIIMGTGTSIRSNDGNGQIDLDYDGTESHVYISSDSGALLEGVLEVSNHYSGLAAKNYFMGVESYDLLGERVTNLWATYTSSIVNIGVSKDYYSTYQQYQDIAVHENSTYVSVSDYNRHAVFIGTRNSGFDAGITNSVIIGGYSMSATQSNTVYLGNNVNINNAYTLPNTDGTSNQVLKTDGAGNVTWQNDSGSSTPTLSQVLLAGNTSSANIILNTGHSIVSSDVSSQTKIQIMGGTATSFFMIDNDTSLLNKAWIVGDFNSFQSGYNDNYLDAMDNYISLHSVTGSVIAKVIANSLNNRISIGIADSSATFSNTQDSIEVLNTRTASITTGNTDKWSTVISSRNSSVNTGIRNSVIIGGSGITASNHNTVYLGNNVNINNKYTLPNVDGTSGQVLKTDGAGNVTWSLDTTGNLESVLSIGNTTGTYSINVENYITFEGQGSTTSITGVGMGTPLSGFQYNVTGDLTSEIYSGAKIRVVNTQGGVNDGSFVITNATYSGGNTHFQWSGIVTNFVPPYGDIITGIESSYLQVNFASASNLYTLPNKSGTIALLSDIVSSTPSLSQVLAVGNTDGGYSIVMSTSSYISDANGKNVFIVNDGYAGNGIYIGTDNYGFTASYTYYQNNYFSYQNYIEQASIWSGAGNSAIYLYISDTSYTPDSSLYLEKDYVSLYKNGTPFPRSISIYTNEISMLGNLNHGGWSNISFNVISGYTYSARLNVVEDQYPNTDNYVLRTSIDNTNVIFGVQANKNVHIGSTGYTASFRYVDGNQAFGKVLTSDADGVASWQTPNGVTGSGSNGRVALWNTSGSLTYNDSIRYGSSDIQIGTSSDPSRVWITTNAVTIEGASSFPQNIMTSYGFVNNQTIYTKYNGTPAAPTDTMAGDVIHEWYFNGSLGYGSRWQVRAAENHTTNKGTSFEIQTAVVGTTSVTEKFAISGTGEIRFNGQGTYSYSFPTYRGLNGQVLQTDGSGNITWQTISSGATGTGLTNYITKWVSLTQLGTASIFDNGTNVGIGNNLTSATARLHIKGASSSVTYAIKVDNNAGTDLFYVRDDGYSIINGMDIGRGKQQTSTNVVLGVNALENSTGLNNIAIGTIALRDTTTGANNTAIGHNALSKNTIGNDNTAIGTQVLEDNTSGYENTSIGAYSMWDNTTGFYNVAIGSQALKVNTTGSNNVAIGWYSLRTATNSVNNVAVGRTALEDATGSYNVGVGYRAGANISTGQYNTAVGNDTMATVTTGNYNTFIGRDTGRNISTGSANTIVGASVTGLSSSTSNNIILADGNGTIRFHTIASGDTGIGTSNPAYKLDVVGDINTSTKYRVGATAGWTGTFSSGSGQTVTVIGGIITSVV